MALDQLRQIGLTEGEISVYEALLIIGECTKTKLAKESGISPSNIYDVTNRLVEKGLISKLEKNGILHFSPANPNKLKLFLEQKKREIEKEESIVSNILPTLLAEYQNVKDNSNVEVFQGWNGMKTIFEDMIEDCKRNDRCYVFGASKGESEESADRFFLKYSEQREKRGIITDIVFNEELRRRKKRIDFFLKAKNHNVRFFMQSTPAEIMLYKDKACILILTKEPLVIRITSKEVMESFKQYFDVMWQLAKP
ncbi:MarR family transcriptional regulator [Candidatus Woesearchaeota archaeon]|nr:MarR family transcriptional regulator [Candidatus Woesearchaeota archaeon]